MNDEDLVKAFVAATSRFSTREAGKLVGVSHSRIADWRRGAIGQLQPGTRRALEQYVEVHGENGGAYAPEETPFAAGGMADEIIHALGDPEWIRRHSGLVSPRDRAEFGYQIALRRQLPPEEMAKILRWRDELLRDEADS